MGDDAGPVDVGDFTTWATVGACDGVGVGGRSGVTWTAVGNGVDCGPGGSVSTTVVAGLSPREHAEKTNNVRTIIRNRPTINNCFGLSNWFVSGCRQLKNYRLTRQTSRRDK